MAPIDPHEVLLDFYKSWLRFTLVEIKPLKQKDALSYIFTELLFKPGLLKLVKILINQVFIWFISTKNKNIRKTWIIFRLNNQYLISS